MFVFDGLTVVACNDVFDFADEGIDVDAKLTTRNGNVVRNVDNSASFNKEKLVIMIYFDLLV